jgi:hypothetical protein
MNLVGVQTDPLNRVNETMREIPLLSTISNVATDDALEQSYDVIKVSLREII